MGKLYSISTVQERINTIAVDEGAGDEVTVSYRDTCCHPRYMYATIVGCVLSGL
jgi:hypothetical protein